MRSTIHALLLSVTLAAAAAGCSDSSGPGSTAGAYAGGGTRANLYPDGGGAVTSFTEVTFDSLTTGFLGAPLPIGEQRIAAVTADHRLLRIAYRSIENAYTFPTGIYPLPELAVDSLGTLYAVTTNGGLHAIDTGGVERWTASIEEIGAESFHLPTWPVTTGGGIVAGSTSGRLRGFGFDGAPQWERTFGAGLVRSVAHRSDVGIVAGVTHGDHAMSDTVIVLDEEGRERWRTAVGGRIEVGPIIVGERIAVGVAGRAADGKYRPALLLLDISGKEKGRPPLDVLPLALAGDAAGNIYVAGGGGSRGIGGVVASFTAEGKNRWDVGLTRNAPLALLVAGESIYFVVAYQSSIGVYSYSLEGTYQAFTPIEALASIVVQPFLYPGGRVTVASNDSPLILSGR